MENTAAAGLQSWLTEMADQTLELEGELDRVPGLVTVQAGSGPGVLTTRYHPIHGQVENSKILTNTNQLLPAGGGGGASVRHNRVR